MKKLKVGDVVAINRAWKWWGEVDALLGESTCVVIFALIQTPSAYNGTPIGFCEYPRSALEPVGVNVR